MIHFVSQLSRFRVPTKSELSAASLVVATLSTARTVASLLPRGHFSHILLDEAAQALETEAVTPLGLADRKHRLHIAEIEFSQKFN